MNEFVPLRGGPGIAEVKPRPTFLAVVRREPDGTPERARQKAIAGQRLT
jgi:hypothetical protein